ncbi:MAG: DUF58 domain-containing protein [Bacteroidetes bacterium]|nr:DUF58 domain-containing protein [Bacteroidota bacterium]
MALDLHKLQQYTHLEILAKQVVEGFITGLHKSPFHGFSVEFAEHRIYNTGESTKHIDWKLYGRTEKLFTKRYEEETNLRCQIIIDNSSSMYFPLKNELKGDKMNKITFSIYCAAAITELLRKQRDAVGLSIFSEDVELHTPAKSSSTHHKYLFSQMENLLENQPENKNTFAVKSLHAITENIHRRSLVVIFSDMMESVAGNDELFSALQHLKHNKHEVMLFHVTDKNKELDFDFESRPYHFIDVESGEEVKVHSNEIKETYLKSVREFKKDLLLKCGQYKIDFIEADVNESFNQVLLPYLIKRSKML